MATFAFEAIGTRWSVEVSGEPSAEGQAALLRRVHDRIEEFDRAYSRFREDSLVTRMSRESGTFALPPDAAPMLAVYRELYDLTNGAFTPLIGQTLVEAGYDANYSLLPTTLHPPPAWDDVLCVSSPKNQKPKTKNLPTNHNPQTKSPTNHQPQPTNPRLTLTRPALLDFGAGGKGYLADLVVREIIDAGFESCRVDAGGDIVFRGMGNSRVALEDPRDTSKAIGIATVGDGSICGSAGNRRAWGAFHHTIDPRTLASPRHLLATWVIADTGLCADALATALWFVSPEKLLGTYTFSYAIMDAQGGVECSPNAPFELFVS